MKKKGRWILATLVLALSGWCVARRPAASTPGRAPESVPAAAPVVRVVPESLRVRVEVLNGTATRGIARRATASMRDAGFDVVGTGNWTEQVDSSLVLVRSGRTDWGQLAVSALGEARLEVRPDSSRYLDLTIVIGRRWRPPPEPFDP